MRIVLALRPAFIPRTVLVQGQDVSLSDVFLVVRFTRHWIHYGFLAHTVVCVLIAAAEGLMGR